MTVATHVAPHLILGCTEADYVTSGMAPYVTLELEALLAARAASEQRARAELERARAARPPARRRR